MMDESVKTLNDIKYIWELRNNLIRLGIIQENGFFYIFDEDRDIMKLSKDVFAVMREKRTTSNIYKLLTTTIIGDLTLFKFNNDATF